MNSASSGLSAERMLQVMGIETWQLRPQSHTGTPQILFGTLAPTVVLVVVSEAVAQQPPLQFLLHNILYAMRLTVDRYCVVTRPQFNAEIVNITTPRQIVSFSNVFADTNHSFKFIDKNTQIVEYGALEQVYQQPLLKRTIMQGLISLSGLAL